MPLSKAHATNFIMANPSSGSSHSSLEGAEVLKLFKDNMRKHWTHTAVDGRSYVRTKRMICWMEESKLNNETPNGALLLDAVYDAVKKSAFEFSPVEWEHISSVNSTEGCIVTFGLLTALGYGHLIHIFRQYDVQDHSLRRNGTIIQPASLEDQFGSTAHLETFINKFERRRWEFCPVEFSINMDTDLHGGRRVLPFCRTLRINQKGATAQLYEVAVEEDFVLPCLRNVIMGTRYPDPEFGLVCGKHFAFHKISSSSSCLLFAVM
jgi:hypothetical protein